MQEQTLFPCFFLGLLPLRRHFEICKKSQELYLNIRVKEHAYQMVAGITQESFKPFVFC